MMAFPELEATGNPTPIQRWAHCQQMTQKFWRRWPTEYLQHLQRAVKWTKKTANYKPGDLVMMTDGNFFQAQWTMAKVVKVYPGQDGLVRAADIQVETAFIPKKYASKTELAQLIKAKTAVYRRPVHKLVLLLPEKEVPGVIPEGLPWAQPDAAEKTPDVPEAAAETPDLPDDVAEKPDQTIP